MKKLLRTLVMTITTICFCIPVFGAAEAATVAILPLINNVQGDELAGQLYYKEAINTLKGKKGFVMVENDQITAAAADVHAGMGLPTAEALKHIAEAGDTDIVFAMELNELRKKERMIPGERVAQLVMEGKAVAYNRLNGAFYSHNIRGGQEVDVALTARFDWTHEQFGRAVRQEIDRALRAK